MTKKNAEVALTTREQEIVTRIGQNKKYREIAAELGLGYETVKTYVTRIRKKLGLSSKLALGLYAHQKGWIK